MAKKFRCSTCGNIVAIDPSREVLQCPFCGKKYRNSFYNPSATPLVAPYTYTAAPTYAPQTVAAPVQQPEAAPAATETQPTLLEEEVKDEELGYEEENYEADEPETDEEWEYLVAAKKAKLKSKKGAHIALLIFSFILIAATALFAYNRLDFETIKRIFADDILGGFTSPELWVDVLGLLPLVLIACGVFILACTHINVANLELKAINTDVDYSKKIASGKKAGYAFCLIFAIFILAYGGLMSVGALLINILGGDAGSGVLDLIIAKLGTIYFVELVAGVIGLAYFSHRIDIAGK